MSLYDPEVKIDLGALVSMRSAAEVLPIVRDKRDELKKACAEHLNTINGLKAKIAKAEKDNEELKEKVEKLNAATTINELKPEAKPHKLSPLLKQRVANAADVLRCMTPVVMSGNGEAPAVEGDRFNSVLKTLHELYNAIVDELPEVMK